MSPGGHAHGDDRLFARLVDDRDPDRLAGLQRTVFRLIATSEPKLEAVADRERLTRVGVECSWRPLRVEIPLTDRATVPVGEILVGVTPLPEVAVRRREIFDHRLVDRTVGHVAGVDDNPDVCDGDRIATLVSNSDDSAADTAALCVEIGVRLRDLRRRLAEPGVGTEEERDDGAREDDRHRDE